MLLDSTLNPLSALILASLPLCEEVKDKDVYHENSDYYGGANAWQMALGLHEVIDLPELGF